MIPTNGALSSRVSLTDPCAFQGEFVMKELLEYGESYMLTFLDFWRFQPRKFIRRRQEDISLYMSPYKFAIFSVAILFALSLAIYSGDNTRIKILTALRLPIDLPEYTLAVMSVIISITSLVLSTLFYFLVVRVWPIRRCVDSLILLEFLCYMYAIRLPLSAFSLFFILWNAQLLSSDNTAYAASCILLFYLYIFCMWIFRLWPGIAQIVGVSTLRAAIGSVIWFSLLLVLCYVGARILF